MEMRHTFSIIYAKKPGILIRLALVLERRGYSIESMSSNIYDPNPKYWEMVITTEGDPAKLEQVKEHLTKLIDVFAVRVLKEAYYHNNWMDALAKEKAIKKFNKKV